MSLITCCPSCGTKFRVVADQLRISDGWVRCGRCQEVFDATQGLQEFVAPVSAPAAPVPATHGEQVTQSAANHQHEVSAHVDAEVPAALHPPSPSQSHGRTMPQDGGDALLPDVDVQAQREASISDTAQGYELPVPVQAALDVLQGAQDVLWDVAPAVERIQASEEPPADAITLYQGPETQLLQANAWLDTKQAAESEWKEDALLEPSLDEAPVAEIPEPLFTEAMPEPTLSASNAPEPDASVIAPEEPAFEQVQETVQTLVPPLPEPVLPEPEVAEVAPLASSAATAQEDVATAATEVVSEEVPSFVRQAQRKAWWNQPTVRFVMGMLVTLLPVTLVLQVAMHERNTLVAWKPQWRPAFEVMCIVLRCELAPRQHIASVVLTGSSFHEDEQPHHYRLGLSIQNQAVTSVATPAVELTLLDSQGQVLVRKVLLPKEIGAPVELAANSEWNGTLPVVTQGLNLPVSGYRVMAFYP